MTAPAPSSIVSPLRLRWDIFCNVIDNHGDLGVCWRLCADLAERGQRVRLWVDHPEDLHWMAPVVPHGIDVCRWTAESSALPLPVADAGDVLVEAFGCALGTGVESWWAEAQHLRAAQGLAAGHWINLEYLTAESYASRFHRLESPVMQGPAAGLHKRFFYPGFTPDTGGLLRETNLLARDPAAERSHLSFLPALPPMPSGSLTVSLFCYEPPPLASWLEQLSAMPCRLLVTAGRARTAVQSCTWPFLADKNPEPLQTLAYGACSIALLPWMSQRQFDALLWTCDFNCVRGEDSLVRALWAGHPFVWHIYAQEDRAHHAKLQAFLDWLDAPDDLREFHAIWNGLQTGSLPSLTPARLQRWRDCVLAARKRLLEQKDLATQLLQEVGALPPAPSAALSVPPNASLRGLA